MICNGKIHPEELKGTGLAPSDFEIIAGKMRVESVIEKGFHPDDQWREEQHKMPNENIEE